MRAAPDDAEGGRDGFAFGAAPRDDPLVYPGAHPAVSFLCTGSAARAGLEIERLAQVDELGVDGGGLAARLAALGATPMDERRPVLAYGSNRSPAQLRSKFGGEPIDRVLPVLRARLGGLAAVYVAAMASYGSVPAALAPDPGATTEVAVTYLDGPQLAVMDRTEGGHGRPTLDPERHPVHLLAGDEVRGCERYRSARPVLTWDGAPIRLAEVGSSGGALAARTQVELQRELLGLWRERVGAFADEHVFVAAVRRPDGVVHRAANAALLALVDEPWGRLGARLLQADEG